MTKYAGIFIASHKVLDAASKDYAQNNFSGWQLESYTSEDWIKKLEAGQTIQPSAFSPKPDGTFTHAIKFWNSTHFVCADADNIKGVEFLDDGTDKNPSGVEYWTEHDGLSKRFPLLKDRAYAVGQSVSSMAKEPLHRRYRLIFLFNAPITSEKHYHQILLALADEFPIIPAVERSPAQPVFGNAREEYNQVHLCGNVLSLDDFPYTPPVDSKDKAQPRLSLDETLEEYLSRHGIEYTHTKEAGKFYVNCPYKDHHSGGKHGATDAYVFDDSQAWAFYCSHASCANRRTWDAFKRGNGIVNGSGATPKRKKNPEAETDTDAPAPDSPFFSGKKFLPMGMHDFLSNEGLHFLSLPSEPGLRVYQNGLYIPENQAKKSKRLMPAMQKYLGVQTFKMSQYEEVKRMLLETITPLSECEPTGHLNVANGILKLENLNILPHTPEKVFLSQLPVSYKPDADCPVIAEWLDDVLENDAGQVKLFLQAVGYTLLQTTELQKMFILLGPTQTGKSTAGGLLRALIGDANCSSLSLRAIDDEDNRFSRSSLLGKVANISADISHRYLQGDGNIKRITAGESIDAEFKGKDRFEFTPVTTLWAMSNKMPASRDKSSGWYQRLLIVEFKKQFLSGTTNPPDTKIIEKLTTDAELSGLLITALIAGRNAIENGDFSTTQKQVDALQTVMELNDHVYGFCQFMTSQIENEWQDAQFYSAYVDWLDSEDSEAKPLSKRKLADSVKVHGISRKRRGSERENRHFVWECV